jgi:hypothetical protein
MKKGKVEGQTQRPQAEEAKRKGQATDLKKEEAKVGIGTETRASPKRPRVHPNVVPPITRQSSFKEDVTIVAYTATNLATVAKD